MNLGFKELNAYLLKHAPSLLGEWLPGGKVLGNEYRCGSIRGGDGGSFSVNVTTGVWAEFDGSGQGGGDLIALYAEINGVSMGEAFKALGGDKVVPGKPYTNGHAKAISATVAEPDIVAPPDDAPMPKFRGTFWRYPDFDGRTLLFVERIDFINEKGEPDKTYKQHGWSKSEGRWVKKGWDGPRPIYGLDVLAKKIKAQVVIVEGEKSCDAARILLPGQAVVAWLGGGNAVLKTDWSPIYNRENVLLWPDADAPGRLAMKHLSEHLFDKVGEIKIVNVDDMPTKWDAGNAVADGWDYARALAWLKSENRMKKYVHAPIIEVPVLKHNGRRVVPMPAADDAPHDLDNNLPRNSLNIFADIPEIPIQYVYSEEGKRKIKPPTQSQIAEHIVAYLGETVMKYDDSFFSYKDTHWIEWQTADFDKLHNTITSLLDMQTGISRVDGVVKFIRKMVKSFDKNPFILNPFLINFTDGTLEINRDGVTGVYSKAFREHRQSDRCLSTIPLNYNYDRTVENLEFSNMISRVTNCDVSKIRMIQQMYGAMLAPVFPHFWFLEGGGGTGKSTVILGASYLRARSTEELRPGGLSMVSPSKFNERFATEPMLGCLVNFVLDIPIHTPIDDAVVKQVEDRVPIHVDRKNRTAVFIPIPAVHIYGCNNLPPTLEWGSNAMARRVTVIKFNKFNAEADGYQRDFARKAFDSCPEGVLNFALEGLDDLLASNGLYYSSEESRERVDDWQIEKAPAALFLKLLTTGDMEIEAPCSDGEIFRALMYIPGGKVSAIKCIGRARFWRWFCAWHRDEYNRAPKIGRNAFLKLVLRTADIKLEKTKAGDRVFGGVIETADITAERQLHFESAVHLNN